MLLTVLLLVALAPVFILVACGGRRLRSREAYLEDIYGGPFPRVGLVVPVKGAPEGVEECLTALLLQDYPDYEVFFAVESANDPAVGAIRAAQARARTRGVSKGRLTLAGKAEGCGQKNWNQLAALGGVDEDVAVLAFCDSMHKPRMDWLRRLVSPIAAGHGVASTAYHHVFSPREGFAVMGRKISVLALYMMQEIPAVTQPWGGSMAVKRAVFQELDVAALWAGSVVDDVTLARRLEQAGERAVPVLGACMETLVQGQLMRDWRIWMERQWLYLKFIYPGSWFGVGVLLYLLAGMLLFSGAIAVLSLCGLVGGATAALCWGFLGVLVLLGLWAKACHPAPGGTLPWLSGFFGTLIMAAGSHARTQVLRHISWGGIIYRVRRGGGVETMRPEI